MKPLLASQKSSRQATSLYGDRCLQMLSLAHKGQALLMIARSDDLEERPGIPGIKDGQGYARCQYMVKGRLVIHGRQYFCMIIIDSMLGPTGCAPSPLMPQQASLFRSGVPLDSPLKGHLP